jgi:hypothetical protein
LSLSSLLLCLDPRLFLSFTTSLLSLTASLLFSVEAGLLFGLATSFFFCFQTRCFLGFRLALFIFQRRTSYMGATCALLPALPCSCRQSLNTDGALGLALQGHAGRCGDLVTSMLFLQMGQQCLFLRLADHVVGLALADTGIDKLLEKTINRRVDVSGKLFD